ncbi:uncharacterized protein LOC111040585 [Myzus persicae]|uniref:uncharacterized protein LOC111040585 n=1 Tax=Myzus persicae TaxID=13164 RepID=UPI000B9350FC|nr:uncharacterized protein LOC111040585 [Myzus persicae]
MGRLDIATAQAWQLSCQDTELQKYEDLENFLVRRCTALETTEAWKIESEETKDLNTKKHGKSSNMKRALVATDAKKVITCVCCSENHRLYNCEAFKKLEVAARKTLVRQSSLCFNCLGPFHAADACRSKYSCQKCKLKHNTLLHYEAANEAIATCNPEGGAAACVMLSTPNTLPKTSLPISTTINHVFLATALVTVKDRWGGYRECRAVLDSESQINFVSKRLANILQLNAKLTALPIRGIGGNETQARSSLELKVKSRLKDFSVNLICHVLPVIIYELPPVPPPASGWKFPIELASELADPNFCQSGPIDLLIGGGTFFELMETERIPLRIDNMSLQSSKFGWIVTGEMKNIC